MSGRSTFDEPSESFPIYYLLLALVVLIGPRVHDQAWLISVRDRQIYYWTYLSNWVSHGVVGLSHFWSLAVEEQFYLAWPLVVWLVPRRRLPWLQPFSVRVGVGTLGVLVVFVSAAVVPSNRVASGVQRAFETSWIRFLGKYSYPIYHIAKFYLAGWVNQGGATERVVRLFGFDALILATATAIALLSWHLIEKHCLRLKDRWTVGTAARVRAPS